LLFIEAMAQDSNIDILKFPLDASRIANEIVPFDNLEEFYLS